MNFYLKIITHGHSERSKESGLSRTIHLRLRVTFLLSLVSQKLMYVSS